MNDDPGPLEVFLEHDVDGVDWHLIAEHVLEHDSRGHLRTWDHEIPYDPFTPPQLDRSMYRSAEDRDRASARASTPPPPSPTPPAGVTGEAQAHGFPSPTPDGAAGAALSVADPSTVAAETDELLVYLVDLDPATMAHPHSPAPSAPGLAPTSAKHDAQRAQPEQPGAAARERSNDEQPDLAAEPTLDPDNVWTSRTPAEEDPAPRPESPSAKKATPTHGRDKKQPSRARAVEREKERDTQRDADREKKRDLTRRDDPGIERDDTDGRDDEPRVPPPPPARAPGNDSGIGMAP